MGSRMQKIAFLIFALMFIAIMAVMNTSILTLGTSANNQLNTTINNRDVALQIYDGTVVSGANVRDVAKAPDKVCSTSLSIEVHTKTSTNTYTANSPYQSTTGTTEGKYINPSATFNSSLTYNENGVVTGIKFQQTN